MPSGRSAWRPGRGCMPRTRPSLRPSSGADDPGRERSGARALRECARRVRPESHAGRGRSPVRARTASDRGNPREPARGAGRCGRRQSGPRWPRRARSPRERGAMDRCLRSARSATPSRDRRRAARRSPLSCPGRAGRGPPGHWWPRDLRSPSPSGRRVPPGREGGPSADLRPPPARRSTRRPAAAVARRGGFRPAAVHEHRSAWSSVRSGLPCDDRTEDNQSPHRADSPSFGRGRRGHF